MCVRLDNNRSLERKNMKQKQRNIIKSIISSSVYFNSVCSVLSIWVCVCVSTSTSHCDCVVVRQMCTTDAVHFFFVSFVLSLLWLRYFSSCSICSVIYLPSSFLMPQTKFNLEKSHFFGDKRNWFQAEKKTVPERNNRTKRRRKKSKCSMQPRLLLQREWNVNKRQRRNETKMENWKNWGRKTRWKR